MPLAPKMPDILASHVPGQIRRRRRLQVAVAAAIAAAAVANVTMAASHDRHAGATTTCQAPGGTSLWLKPQSDLHPTPGSPAAFRLADQGNTTRRLNTQPELYPTLRSPAAFRLADQRNLLGIANTCTQSPLPAAAQRGWTKTEKTEQPFTSTSRSGQSESSY
jgi:hypothetical protein